MTWRYACLLRKAPYWGIRECSDSDRHRPPQRRRESGPNFEQFSSNMCLVFCSIGSTCRSKKMKYQCEAEASHTPCTDTVTRAGGGLQTKRPDLHLRKAEGELQNAGEYPEKYHHDECYKRRIAGPPPRNTLGRTARGACGIRCTCQARMASETLPSWERFLAGCKTERAQEHEAGKMAAACRP